MLTFTHPFTGLFGTPTFTHPSRPSRFTALPLHAPLHALHAPPPFTLAPLSRERGRGWTGLAKGLLAVVGRLIHDRTR